ncbi:MAG: ArgE/DapE family deacylase [Knoellia sp.]
MSTTAELTASERAALGAVDPSAIVRDLAALIAIPSVGGTSEESEIQHQLARAVSDLDLDVDLWAMDMAALTGSEGYPGMEAPRSEGWGLVGTTAGEAPQPRLILQGHVDVVPSGALQEWEHEPFTPVVTADRVHGRGACDMKAGVVANLAAVAAIRRAGIRLRDPLALHFVIGEEDGGIGAYGTLARGHTGDACLITEPTSGTLTVANAGALTFSITVRGRATHASTAYEGSSAIDSYVAIHHGLARLQERRNQEVDALMREYPVAYPISVGILRAGDWASSVPDVLVAEGRLGVALDEDPQDARRELEAHVAAVAAADPYLRDHPPLIEWTGGQFASGRSSATPALADTIRAAHADITGRDRPRDRGAPYGSDLRLYEGAGIPTLHYGPGDVRLAHSPQESVSIEECVAVTRALVLTVLRTCGTAD